MGDRWTRVSVGERGEGQWRGRQSVSSLVEVAAFPAPLELTDICSRSRVAKLSLPVWDERQQWGLAAPRPSLKARERGAGAWWRV